MGRAGIEPATLGLKVVANDFQRTARNRNCLQTARKRNATNATNCTLRRQVRTSWRTRTDAAVELQMYRSPRFQPVLISSDNGRLRDGDPPLVAALRLRLPI